MRWKRYSIAMDMTGITRKRAAEILAETFKSDYKYNFDSGGYTIKDRRGRIWNLLPSDNIKAEKILNSKIVGANYLYQIKLVTPFFYANDFASMEELTKDLKTGGTLVNDTTKMSVILDVAGMEHKERYKTNLANLYKSKGILFQKAIGKDFNKLADCSRLDEEGTAEFSIFKSTLNSQELLSYIQMAQVINNYARRQKLVSQKVNLSANEKFLMRTWLVRAGMVGEEYKFARKLLTESLPGNSAWLNKVNCMETQNYQVNNEEQMMTDENDISM